MSIFSVKKNGTEIFAVPSAAFAVMSLTAPVI